MDTVQRRTFNYFWEGAEPNSGLARERIHMDGVYPENDQNVITSGGSGFGIMAILAGIDRGYVTRQEGLERMEKIVSFLETADRFHGAYPHWWYGDTGKVKPFGQKEQWRRPGRNSLHHAGAALRPPVLHRRFARRASPRRPHRQAVARSGLELLPPERPERALLALESGIRLGNELSRTRLQRMPHHVYPCRRLAYAWRTCCRIPRGWAQNGAIVSRIR